MLSYFPPPRPGSFFTMKCGQSRSGSELRLGSDVLPPEREQIVSVANGRGWPSGADMPRRASGQRTDPNEHYEQPRGTHPAESINKTTERNESVTTR
jgi:hypothetical protein